jgi:WS/DGAT/MGAT family acyltransferase
MSAADVAFFHLEGRTTPQHVGGIAIFSTPADGFDYDRLVRLLDERISLVPRYRQKIRNVPGSLANPVWVDDPSFDITYHVRRSALPRPGSDQQLLEFCARIQSRLLDRNRPLWEMYLIEGLSHGRVAICTKTHHAMVDENGSIDIAQVILDASPEPRRTVQALWMPGPEPSGKDLVKDALGDIVNRPVELVEVARGGVRDLVRGVRRAGSAVTGVASTAISAVVRAEPPSPLQAALSEQRRLAVARTELQDYRRVRAAYGGTVNDVVLATITGALRDWLLYRGEPVHPMSTVRALVPLSRWSTPSGDSARSQISAVLVDLPVGEADPVVRLNRISFALAAHTDSSGAVGADRLAALSGFAPPTLHALGARAANGLAGRLFSIVITNVPGPQLPLYAAGARMLEMFPILPLSDGKAVSIGLTSYDGGVFYGINGDRDAMSDVGVLGSLIEESLAALLELLPAAPPPDRPQRETEPDPAERHPSGRRSRGRKAGAAKTPDPGGDVLDLHTLTPPGVPTLLGRARAVLGRRP